MKLRKILRLTVICFEFEFREKVPSFKIHVELDIELITNLAKKLAKQL